MLHNPSWNNSLSSSALLICLAASFCFHLVLFVLLRLWWPFVQPTAPPHIRVAIGLSSVASAAPEVISPSDKPLRETKVFPPRIPDIKQDRIPEAATPRLRNPEKPVQEEPEPKPTETKPVPSEAKVKGPSLPEALSLSR